MPEIKGIIHEIFDEIQINETFKKREFVIETYPGGQQWPEFPIFQLIGDRSNIIEKFDIGDTVEVHFNWRGRPWTNKLGKRTFFNSLQAWKIVDWHHDKEGADAQYKSEPKTKQPVQTNMFNSSSSNDDDDLPF